MERFLEPEMDVVSSIHKQQDVEKWKYKTFHVILENDFNNVPEGFTTICLRDTPVQVVPDDCIRLIKLISLRGFFYENNERRLRCFYSLNSEDGERVYRQIMECVVSWMDKNL
jgi:hypothetical protein